MFTTLTSLLVSKPSFLLETKIGIIIPCGSTWHWEVVGHLLGTPVGAYHRRVCRRWICSGRTARYSAELHVYTTHQQPPVYVSRRIGTFTCSLSKDEVFTVTRITPWKTAARINVLFGAETLGSPSNTVLCGSSNIPTARRGKSGNLVHCTFWLIRQVAPSLRPPSPNYFSHLIK